MTYEGVFRWNDPISGAERAGTRPEQKCEAPFPRGRGLEKKFLGEMVENVELRRFFNGITTERSGKFPFGCWDKEEEGFGTIGTN
jgi:hypothetical protein